MPIVSETESNPSGGPAERPISWSRLAGNHDLSLSDWGPWARNYVGLSHIACPKRGHRMDFFLAPGMYRREVFPPDGLRECGLSMREAAADLHYYGYRQQMRPGRDEIYADVAHIL